MRLIGILGGVAGGKSLVAKHLVSLGARLFDADHAAHEVLRLRAIEEAARHRWGTEIFGPDGRIDRARLARIVFADSPEAGRERKYLEQQTHPEIGKRLRRWQQRMAAEGVAVAVLDAPLLLEAGWDAFCDTLWFVDAPRQQRLTRAFARGWTEENFEARQQAQESLDQKRQRADFVIDNSGPPAQTQAQIERLWADFQ